MCVPGGGTGIGYSLRLIQPRPRQRPIPEKPAKNASKRAGFGEFSLALPEELPPLVPAGALCTLTVTLPVSVPSLAVSVSGPVVFNVS